MAYHGKFISYLKKVRDNMEKYISLQKLKPLEHLFFKASGGFLLFFTQFVQE